MKTIVTYGLLLTGLVLAPGDAAWGQVKGVDPWRPVKDEVGLFTPRAEEQANERIAEIKRKFNKDLVIEAIHPPKRPKDLDIKDKAAVNKFFDRMAEQRFQDLHENGLYVMLVDDPNIHQIRVVVGNNTIAKGYFSIANRDRLIEILREKLNANDKDGALAAATNYVYDTMSANHPVNPRKGEIAPVAHVDGGHNAVRSGFNWTPIISIVLVIAAVWIVFAIVRALFSGGGGAPGMGYGGGGGGGFMSSLLGGMFGAAAGMWMYNSFFGHGGSSAWGANPGAGDFGKEGYDAPDTSGSVGGADYGKDEGGDWGGGGDAGDAGGGDWGGGDAGGGGDWGGGGDFGGGGGDW